MIKRPDVHTLCFFQGVFRPFLLILPFLGIPAPGGAGRGSSAPAHPMKTSHGSSKAKVFPSKFPPRAAFYLLLVGAGWEVLGDILWDSCFSPGCS